MTPPGGRGRGPSGDDPGEGWINDAMFMGDVAVGDDEGDPVMVVAPGGDEVGTPNDEGGDDELELLSRLA